MTKAGELVRFGSETNWSSIVHQQDFSMLLVKNDGTLWHWGILTNWNWKTKWPGLQSFTPYRLGTESNWAEIFLADHELCLRKTDGSIWTRWYTHMDNEKQTIKLEPGFSMQRSALADHGKWLTTATTLVGLGFRLCVCENGTFRICADQKLNEQSHAYDWTPVNLQLGKDTNWLGMAGRDQKIVTLKNDGTLWLWAFHHDNWRAWNPELDEREMLEAIPVRLGTHSDWIGVASTDGGIISLAADGSLWYWPLESAGYFSDTVNRRFLDNGHSHFEPLFDISRKPEFLANIFGKSD
jgi:alpha-tubulin suppressor-like RCC1 family protein